MAGITTGTETSISTVIIIMDMDPAITINPVIIIDPAIIITQGLIIRVVATTGVGIDEKKAKGVCTLELEYWAEQHAHARAALAG